MKIGPNSLTYNYEMIWSQITQRFQTTLTTTNEICQSRCQYW